MKLYIDKLHILKRSNVLKITFLLPMLYDLSLLPPFYVIIFLSVTHDPSTRSGIFVQSVKRGGLAAVAGLRVNDQLLACNGKNLSVMDNKQVRIKFYLKLGYLKIDFKLCAKIV